MTLCPFAGGGMPWKECHVEDERLRFVARLLDGEKMARLCARVRDLTEDRLQDLRPLQGLRRAGLQRPEPAAASAGQSAAGAGRGADRAPEAGVSELGRTEDSREAAAAVPRAAPARRSARCMRCWIGTASCASPPPPATRPPARPCRGRPTPTRCGVPTTKANSCSAIGATATR